MLNGSVGVFLITVEINCLSRVAHGDRKSTFLRHCADMSVFVESVPVIRQVKYNWTDAIRCISVSVLSLF